MKDKDILAIYKTGPEAVIKLIDSFMATITEFQGAGEAARLLTSPDEQNASSFRK